MDTMAQGGLVLVSTVAENKTRYTNTDIQCAIDVRNLQ